MAKNEVNGFWSLLHANRWMKITFVTIASFVALVISGCIIYGFTHGYVYSGKYGEFAPQKKENNPTIITKKNEPNSIENKEKSDNPKIIYIKTKPELTKVDTSKSTSSQVNVTSYNQSGGITANKVTIEKIKKDRVLKMQDEVSLSVKLPYKDQAITVWSLMGDPESYKFAKQIHTFLITSKYSNVYQNIRTYMRTPPFYGAEIKWDENEKTNNIYVGIAPEN
ncbi:MULTISPECIES: hypothetical protein [Flavobacterium]|uniref:Quinol oxidase n=1 Tax=Flavobacterium hankyongi TaxID=1176532 RepID=A0ABP9A9J1_9FLAO|nr:hypothetical protein [Flavobacterium sp. N1846]